MRVDDPQRPKCPTSGKPRLLGAPTIVPTPHVFYDSRGWGITIFVCVGRTSFSPRTIFHPSWDGCAETLSAFAADPEATLGVLFKYFGPEAEPPRKGTADANEITLEDLDL